MRTLNPTIYKQVARGSRVSSVAFLKHVDDVITFGKSYEALRKLLPWTTPTELQVLMLSHCIDAPTLGQLAKHNPTESKLLYRVTVHVEAPQDPPREDRVCEPSHDEYF